MTEREICRSYRNAANQNAQIQILTELTGKRCLDIIMALAQNGAEYKEIAKVIQEIR